MVEEKEDRFTLFKQGDERIFSAILREILSCIMSLGGADYKRRDKNA